MELMIELYIVCALFIFGAALGSFAAASVWRLRATQLATDTLHGEHVSVKEMKQVKRLNEHERTMMSDRSLCLHCGRQLRWYDMLPVVSWLLLQGKCRDCRQPIGKMEFYAEVFLGLGFVVSYYVWPYGFDAQGSTFFVLWCIALVLLAIHWMYDAKWFLLLDKITVLFAAVAVLYLALRLAELPNELLVSSLISTGYVLLALPGFYGLLYLLSRGTWIGFGDVKLLVPFAFMLSTWQQGVLLIFLANLIGCVAILPMMLRKKLTRTTRIPFGPFLILAFVVTFLFGQRIIDFYLGTILF